MTTSDGQDEATTQAGLPVETCRACPLLDPGQEEHNLMLTTAGMTNVLQTVNDVDVDDDVSTSGDNERSLADALPPNTVKRPKGTGVCCRLVCTGCY